MSALDTLCINTIRCLTADMVQRANSGHPGMPMGMAPVAHVLFSKHLNFSPNTKWANRDRWVLSNGHGCCLQYIMLHFLGILTMDDLKSYRVLHSRTPGHPEVHLTPGVEVTTGPLGQGFANAVGMAIAQEHLKTRFNRQGFPIVDHKIYVFCGDGCLMEGITSEAGSLAGHLGLANLIVIYDDNNVSIDGHADITFTENVGMRFQAYGWNVQTVEKGDSDLEGISKAIEKAKQSSDKPNLIILKTTIGYGSKKEGTPSVHGSPLGEEEVKYVKRKFGFNENEYFYVPQEVYEFYQKLAEAGKEREHQWKLMFNKYREKYPDLAKIWEEEEAGKLPENWESALPTFPHEGEEIATRKLSGQVLNALADKIPTIIGGAADLATSTNAMIKNSPYFQKGKREGRNIAFGAREHAMCAIANGMAAYGHTIPFASTFLIFTTYCFAAIRLSALSHFQVLYIMTHDSIGLGEDGPTHQPIEVIPMLRATPNLLVFRPADGNEVSGSYRCALKHSKTPSVICLTRQNVPPLPGSSIEQVEKGAYVLIDCKGKPDVILAATGSEVWLCVEALRYLKKRVRIVSMPSHELFDQQSEEYKKQVFPENVPVLSVEAASPLGWEKYSDEHLGMNTFGMSGPYKKVFEYFGFTAENVAKKAEDLMIKWERNH